MSHLRQQSIRRMAISKESLLQSAIIALTQNPGMSYAELANKMGIGRATLYRHFAGRDELIKELVLFSLHETDRAIRPLTAQALKSEDLLYDIIAVLIPIGERFHFLSQIPWEVWEDEEVKQLYLRQDEEFAQMMDYMQQEGKIRADMPRAWIVAVFDNLIYTAWASVREGKIARNDATDLVYRTFMSGFGK